MCLSSVYKVHGENAELFCKNIQSVKAEPNNTLHFIDIMGVTYTSIGRITNIDLVNNIIDVVEEENETK